MLEMEWKIDVLLFRCGFENTVPSLDVDFENAAPSLDFFLAENLFSSGPLSNTACKNRYSQVVLLRSTSENQFFQANRNRDFQWP